MKKNISLGDYVSVIDESISGTIVVLNSHRAILEDEFGFELEFPISKLVLKNNLDIQNVSPNEKHEEYIESTRKERVDTIDLHIETLKIRHDKLTIPIIEYQINAFHEAIFEARKNKLDSLIVIHGKGEGKLQSKLYHELKKYSDLNYNPITEGSMKNAAFKINFINPQK